MVAVFVVYEVRDGSAVCAVCATDDACDASDACGKWCAVVV